jgi:hypothetical protein
MPPGSPVGLLPQGLGRFRPGDPGGITRLPGVGVCYRIHPSGGLAVWRVSLPFRRSLLANDREAWLPHWTTSTAPTGGID